MTARFAFLLVVVLCVALGTAVLGWAGIPLAAAVIGGGVAARGLPRAAGRVALGAALAWATLLAWDAMAPRFGTLANALGSIVHVPIVAVVFATLALPALLAWAAAALAEELVTLGRARLVRARPADGVTLPAPGAPARPTGSPAAASP